MDNKILIGPTVAKGKRKTIITNHLVKGIVRKFKGCSMQAKEKKP